MKILDAKLANDGTVLQGFAVSTRGRRYRWFIWSNGCLSVDREEEEPLWPGVTHWSSLWGRLDEVAVKAAIRAAVVEIDSHAGTTISRGLIASQPQNVKEHHEHGQHISRCLPR